MRRRFLDRDVTGKRGGPYCPAAYVVGGEPVARCKWYEGHPGPHWWPASVVPDHA